VAVPHRRRNCPGLAGACRGGQAIGKRWAGRALSCAWPDFLFVLALACFGFLIVQGGGSVIREIRQLANTVAVQDEWMLPDWLQGSGLKAAPTTAGRAAAIPESALCALTGDQGQLVLPAILGFTRGIPDW
jgi:hypothetical protein